MQADASWGMILPPPQPAQPAMDQPVPQQQEQAQQEKKPAPTKEKFQGSSSSAPLWQGSDKTDISDPSQISDWLPIGASILLVLALLVLSFRYLEFWGKSVNNWYNTFGLSAVLLDVGFVGLIFTIGRWLYTKYVRPRMDGEWSTPAFMGTLVGTQVAHHFLFNHLVLRMAPVGENAMLDLMRSYANNEPFKALTGHTTTLVAGSALVAAAMKAAPTCIQVGAGLLGLYAIPYALTTREKF
jgi:hypothetical protein